MIEHGFEELASDLSPTRLNTEEARRGLPIQGRAQKKNQGEKRYLRGIEILSVYSGLEMKLNFKFGLSHSNLYISFAFP
jgi:hypothetical protein